MFFLKTADHAADRFHERLPEVPVSVLEQARRAALYIPKGSETRMHLPLSYNGKVVGYAAYKRVGKNGKPVLATILGPTMVPYNSHLLNAQQLLQQVEDSMKKEALYVPTYPWAKVGSDEEGAPRASRFSRVRQNLSQATQGVRGFLDTLGSRNLGDFVNPEIVERMKNVPLAARQAVSPELLERYRGLRDSAISRMQALMNRGEQPDPRMPEPSGVEEVVPDVPARTDPRVQRSLEDIPLSGEMRRGVAGRQVDPRSLEALGDIFSPELRKAIAGLENNPLDLKALRDFNSFISPEAIAAIAKLEKDPLDPKAIQSLSNILSPEAMKAVTRVANNPSDQEAFQALSRFLPPELGEEVDIFRDRPRNPRNLSRSSSRQPADSGPFQLWEDLQGEYTSPPETRSRAAIPPVPTPDTQTSSTNRPRGPRNVVTGNVPNTANAVLGPNATPKERILYNLTGRVDPRGYKPEADNVFRRQVYRLSDNRNVPSIPNAFSLEEANILARERAKSIMEGLEAAGVKPVELNKALIEGLDAAEGASEARAGKASMLAGFLSGIRRYIDRKGYEKDIGGSDPSTWTPEQRRMRGQHIEDMLKELTTLDPSDPRRMEILKALPTEDRKLLHDLTSSHMRGIMKGMGMNMLKKPLWAAGAAGTAGLLTSRYWAPPVMRAVLKRNLLSEEEKNLPPEEQDRLMAERSPIYAQLLRKNDDSSDITVSDVLSIPGTAMEAANLSMLSAGFLPKQYQDIFNNEETLARLVGARRLFHGTTVEAGKKILQSGLDPGYGGSPTGFTFKANLRQSLSDELKKLLKHPGFQSLPEKEQEDLIRKFQFYGVGLGAQGMFRFQNQDGSPHIELNLLENLQPRQALPGLAAARAGQSLKEMIDPRIPEYELDTSKFLSNAKGNIFVAEDPEGARRYALSQNPELQADIARKGYEAFQNMMEEAIPGFKEKGMGALITNKELNLRMPSLKSLWETGKAYRDLAVGVKATKDTPYLLGMAIPEEDYRTKFEIDEDDVQQGGALRLKPEHRVTPYAETGEYPEVGAPTPHNKEIRPDQISVEAPTLRQIWRARSKNWLDYARGKGLSDDERLLGLNKRFLSGVGRGALSSGIKGLMLYRAFSPLGKKLYRKAKERRQAQDNLENQLPAETSTEETPLLPDVPVPPSMVKSELSASPLPMKTASVKTAATKTRTFAGLRVRVDRPKGYVQEGKDPQGNPWTRVYLCDYGYLAGTQGGDGDGIDVFLGPDENGKAFLFLQHKEDGSFDEFKLLLGFPDLGSARDMYEAHVPKKYIGKAREIPIGVLQGLTGVSVDSKKVAQEVFLNNFNSSLESMKRSGPPLPLQQLLF